MASARHFGMDWLRIAAFALLIAYHVAMVFAPWHWVVKWPQTYDVLVVPMALLTPWRLPLLFAVSGFATRKLMMRGGSFTTFARARSVRLLVPLLFAMVALLPPELWVRAREVGYPGTLGHYWLADYWLTKPVYGLGFPAWEHLWFVLYLWTYTMLLAALVARVGAAAIQRCAERLLPGARILWVPLALLATAKLALMFVVPENHGLASDWSGHAEYVPMFLFGFVVAESPALWRDLHRQVRAAIPIAGVAGAIVAATERAYPGDHLPSHLGIATERVAQVAMAWAMVLLLFALADRALNRDHRWRAPLAEAVFPAYLIHHPVIVCATWAMLPLGLSAPVAFAALLAITAAACAAFYHLARRVAWLRPFAGLGPAPAPRPLSGAMRIA